MNLPFVASLRNKLIAIGVIFALIVSVVLWQKGRTAYDHWRDSIAAAAVAEHKGKIEKLEQTTRDRQEEIRLLNLSANSLRAQMEQYKTDNKRLAKEQGVLREQVKLLDAALVAARESASNVPEADLLPAIRRTLHRLRPGR